MITFAKQTFYFDSVQSMIAVPEDIQILSVIQSDAFASHSAEVRYMFDSAEPTVPTTLYLVEATQIQTNWDFNGTPVYQSYPAQVAWQGTLKHKPNPCVLFKFSPGRSSNALSQVLRLEAEAEDAIIRAEGLQFKLEDVQREAEGVLQSMKSAVQVGVSSFEFQTAALKEDYGAVIKKCDLKFTPAEKDEVFRTWPVSALALYEVIYKLVNQLYE